MLVSNIESTEHRGLNAGNLKMIALFCMVTDHMTVGIFWPWLCTLIGKPEYKIFYSVYLILRMLGRPAFPIFAYFIVEGYSYTKSKIKYALRLFVIAAISEIPFDLAIKHKMYYPNYQNVFWTLLAALLTVWAADEIQKNLKNVYFSFILRFAITNASFAIMQFAAKSDYGALGVCAVTAVFYSKKDEKALALSTFCCSLLMNYFSDFTMGDPDNMYNVALSLFGIILFAYYMRFRSGKERNMAECCSVVCANGADELFSFVNVYLMTKYNGERGKMPKWFFYIFYPAHFAVIAILGKALHLY